MKKNKFSKFFSLLAAFALLFNSYYLPLMAVVKEAYAVNPSANLDQCANGDSASPTDPCVWQNGNLNSNQAHYVEGQSVPYRVIMETLPLATSITLTLGYDIKNSGAHALDYLTHYNRLEPHGIFGHSAETINPTFGVAGLSSTETTYTIPSPSSAGSPVAGQPTNSFNTLPAGEKVMTLYGGTITNITYNIEGVLTDAQSETTVDITFTVDSETAVLAWGGHIASRLDWGEGNSAGGINGSPYHMSLKDWTLGNLGSQDRSLQAGAVYSPVGDLTIIKNTLPDTDDSTGFSFTGGAGAFTLTGNGDSQTFYGLDQGTYSVQETSLAGWNLTNISCEGDQDGGSIIDLESQSVSIDLDDGEAIICTFTNTKDGQIKIVKDATPDHEQDFEFTRDFGENFFLDDDADVTRSNQISFGVSPSTYNVSEIVPSGWELSNSSCSDGSPVSAIDVGAGEQVICTFYNTKLGKIIVEKQTNPDQAEGVFSFTGDLSGDISDDGTLENEVSFGQYTVAETDPGSAWDLNSIQCDDVESVAPSLGDLGTNTATFNVEPGEIVKCTFTNVKLPTLEVIKNLSPTNDTGLFNLYIDRQLFAPNVGHEGTTGPQTLSVGDHYVGESAGTDTNLADYNRNFSGNCPSGAINLQPGNTEVCTITNTRKIGTITFDKIVVGGDADESGWIFRVLDQLFSDGDQGIFDTGTYTVIESGPDGYTATDVGGVCSNLDGVSATLTVTEGGGVCRFTNTRDIGSVTVNKQVDTDGNGIFDYGNTTANQLGFNWNLNSGAQDWNMGDTIQSVETGGHQVTENDLEGYHAVGWYVGEGNCLEPEGLGLTADFFVTKDQETIVTFCNQRDTGTIKVLKDVDPDDPSLWDIDISGPTNNSKTIGDKGSTGELISATGDYTISETASSGTNGNDYTSLFTCSIGEVEIASGSGKIINVSLSKGENISCTFTNTIKRGSITVNKQTNPRDTEQTFTFNLLGDSDFSETFDITGSGTDTFSDLLPDTYLLAEMIPDGWSLTDARCTGEKVFNNGGIVTVTPNENVTCTFINTKIVLGISIEKTNDKTSGATAGEIVTYKLIVTNDGNVPLYGIDIIDVLPGGFEYVFGSTAGTTTSDPTILSGKLTWQNAGNLLPGESLAITYQATISSDIDQGIYINLATCKVIVGGESVENGIKTSESIHIYKPETIWCEIDDSSVPIGVDFNYSDGLRGEVLGAATELPATGNDTRVLIMLLTMLALGASLKVVSYNMAEKKERKNA